MIDLLFGLVLMLFGLYLFVIPLSDEEKKISIIEEYIEKDEGQVLESG